MKRVLLLFPLIVMATLNGINTQGNMMTIKRTRPAFKLWLETEEGHVFGPGVFSLLVRIDETGTLKEAAQSLGMSYRYAWGLIRKAEVTLGEPLIVASKGGRLGGGSTEITELSRGLLEDFKRIRDVLDRVTTVLDAKPIRAVVESFELRDDDVCLTVKLDRDIISFSLMKDALAGLSIGDSVRLGLYLS